MFDEEKAKRTVDFINCLKHTKGKWRGQPFDLLPWQERYGEIYSFTVILDTGRIAEPGGHAHTRIYLK